MKVTYIVEVETSREDSSLPMLDYELKRHLNFGFRDRVVAVRISSDGEPIRVA